MCDVSFSVEAVVRGFHANKDIWMAVVGELSCRREPTNHVDRFTVVVVKDSNDVGQAPRKNFIHLFIVLKGVWKHHLPCHRK